MSAEPAGPADAAGSTGTTDQCLVGAANTAGPTTSAMPGQHAEWACGSDRTRPADSTGAARPTGAEQRNQLAVGTTSPTCPAIAAGLPKTGKPGATGPADAAGPTIASTEEAIGTPGSADTAGAARGRRGSAGPTSATGTPQPSRPTGTAGLPGCPGSAVPAVAEQPPAVPAGLPGSGDTISAVADQRATRQVLDRIQCLQVLDALQERLQRRGRGSLSGRIRLRTGDHTLSELGM